MSDNPNETDDPADEFGRLITEHLNTDRTGLYRALSGQSSDRSETDQDTLERQRYHQRRADELRTALKQDKENRS